MERQHENDKKSPWLELTDNKQEFQHIVDSLVRFDEDTGRYRQYPNAEVHFMRQAIREANPVELRIFVQDLGGFVYRTVVELQCEGGFVATAWVHEDGVQAERAELEEYQNHP